MPITVQKNLPAVVTSQMAIMRLRELHFERAFQNQKAPTAATFAYKSASPMDQLLAFSSISRWLLERLNAKLQTFSEFDEPNAIALEIINASKPFVDCSSLAPHELRTGSGDTVSALILALSEAVLEKQQLTVIAWKDPQATQQQAQNIEDDDQDEDFIDDVFMTSFSNNQQTPQNKIAQQEIAPGIQDIHKWNEEQLQVEQQLNASKYAQVNQDWRPDIQKLTTLASQLSTESSTITQQIQVVSEGIGKQLERLTQREQFLNQQISSFSGKLIEVSRKHQSLTKEQDEVQQEISVLNEQLLENTDKFKRAKSELTAENNRITDTSGLSFAKQAIASLSSEIRDIDLKIVLAQQRLFSGVSQ
ncbi:Intraflagellar transport protein 57 [Spironucleus salmonicida]|uniref:Intraflagellar transport protein 57 n=1 Tax=Spironucleus salmonicida TaxID=348837 RepID=V6LDQ8_9EUKA|nr:Intraflagellar transport protein 57 [Spironucleus salmonicida]|eukprot:EST41816.1 Intraflagellar transport protein 57 [Spironucleus salmonicida]